MFFSQNNCIECIVLSKLQLISVNNTVQGHISIFIYINIFVPSINGYKHNAIKTTTNRIYMEVSIPTNASSECMNVSRAVISIHI